MRNALLVLFCITALTAGAQKNGGIEQYLFVTDKSTATAVPMLWYQSKAGWYSSLRYNYEDAETVSFFSGKQFARTWGTTAIAATPMAGLLWGTTKGAATAVKLELEANNFYFITEPQYCVSFAGAANNFYYNWSEAGVAPLPFLYTGVALQHTKVPLMRHQWEAGLVAGLVFKNMELPIYLFNPFQKTNYLVVGLNWHLNK